MTAVALLQRLLTRLLLGAIAGFALIGAAWIFGSPDHNATTGQLYRSMPWGALYGFIAAALLEIPPFIGELRYQLRHRNRVAP